jgi:very-short-patch-repair endonuclease
MTLEVIRRLSSLAAERTLSRWLRDSYLERYELRRQHPLGGSVGL